MTTPINTIETAMKHYAAARESLGNLVSGLNDEINALKKSHTPAIKLAVARATERHDALVALIGDNPDSFKKPKSITAHGLRAGFRKQAGALGIDDEDATLRRIKVMFKGDEAMLAQLIKTTEKPSKDGLAELKVDQLKRLGVTVTNDSDVAFAKPVDSDVDKLVSALLKGAEENEE